MFLAEQPSDGVIHLRDAQLVQSLSGHYVGARWSGLSPLTLPLFFHLKLKLYISIYGYDLSLLGPVTILDHRDIRSSDQQRPSKCQMPLESLEILVLSWPNGLKLELELGTRE